MQENAKNYLTTLLKGVIITVVFTLITVLIFASVVRVFYLSTETIKGVNQFIKCLSIFVGCFFSVKEKGGIVKGIGIGMLATLITYLIFMLISKNQVIGIGAPFFLDLFFSMITGGISGIIAVNIRK